MATAIIATVVGGLILAGILAAIRWLQDEDHRSQLRQLVCRHDWQPIDKGRPGDAIVFVTPYDEYCRKCDAQRMLD
jgi:hypothetical protein